MINLKRSLAVLFLSLVLATASKSGYAATFTFNSKADIYFSGNTVQNTNNLIAGRKSGTYDTTYLKFDISDTSLNSGFVLDKSSITSATLKLFLVSASGCC